MFPLEECKCVYSVLLFCFETWFHNPPGGPHLSWHVALFIGGMTDIIIHLITANSVFQDIANKCQQSGYTGLLVAYKCDLSNEEEILAMFSAIKSQHGGVDVCINNAGLAHPDSILNGKTSSWRNMLQVAFVYIKKNKIK